jgi:hypothetical protein
MHSLEILSETKKNDRYRYTETKRERGGDDKE